MNNRFSMLTGACLASLLALPGAAFAQSESEEIVVTAQKREQAIQDVPLAVQAIGADALETAGVRQVGDLVRFIPGASIVNNTTAGRETISIRGIAAGTTGDGLVGFYIDETPFSIPNLQLSPPGSLIDVQRVEVVRGPSGTLYGSGAMGGNIKIVTRTPDTTEFSGLLRGEYSNTSDGDDNHNINGVLNVPILRDRLAVRLNAGIETLGGYAEAPEFNRSDVNGMDANSYRGVLLWTPTDTIDVSLTAWTMNNRQDFNNNLTAAQTIAAGSPIITGTGGRPSYQNTDMDLYSATANWDLGFATLTGNVSNIIHSLKLNDATSFVVNNFSDFRTVQTTGEVRLTSSGDGPFQWIVGAFKRDAIIKSYLDVRIVPSTPLIFSYGTIETDSYAVFGEVSYDFFGGMLTPTLGVRYSEDDRGGFSVNFVDSTRALRGAVWESTNPRFNLRFRPTEDAMFYINVAKGFRSGSFQSQGQVDAAALLGIPTQTGVDPDSVWTYEIGTKLSVSSDFQVEASVYHSDFEDIIVQFVSPAIVSLANGGDAAIDGVDLAFVWRTPVDGLDVNFNGSLLNTNFENVVPALSVALPTISEGRPLPNVPTSNYTIGADYVRPSSMWPGVDWRLHGSYSFRGSQIDAASGRVSGELNDLTLRAGLEGTNWRANVFALNALDDDDPAVRTATGIQILYPRRIGVQLGFDF
ncbi:MAG: TonB-dependent receptor plug domain-containing protein [Alphaproteobacteria bacterium]|nr:TonB-dependent receptor plug domain-containing protein [Alphaproteobacteria bacterium]